MRDELEDLFCRIYVDGGVALTDLATRLAETLGGAREDGAIVVGRARIEAQSSAGYDPSRRHDPQTGFLAFRYCLELSPLPGQTRVAQIALTRTTLEALWAWGMTAVASCDYEQALPNEGYNSRYAPAG